MMIPVATVVTVTCIHARLALFPGLRLDTMKFDCFEANVSCVSSFNDDYVDTVPYSEHNRQILCSDWLCAKSGALSPCHVVRHEGSGEQRPAWGSETKTNVR